jgi:FkbM family methyltransferase
MGHLHVEDGHSQVKAVEQEVIRSDAPALLDGTILAFEPSHDSFTVLTENLKLNRISTVKAFNIALADSHKTVKLFHHPDASRNSLGEEGGSSGFEEVTTDTLDSVLVRENVASVDVIKMDVEGAEELVLRGAQKTIRRSHPAVIFEINRSASSALGLEESGAWSVLETLGYEFYSCNNRTGEMYRISEPPAGGNVVALWKSGHLRKEMPGSW